VFKVLKPGVEERLEQELLLLERVGSYLDEVCTEFGLPHLDYREAFEQVREKLRHEVRLDREQGYLARARAFYAGEPRVYVPALFEHCTRRVTAVERLTGGKITDHRLIWKGEKRWLADLAVEALIAMPVFAGPGPALFHADPHAGNLFLTAEGRLGILDWSLVGALGEPERRAAVQIVLGALTLRPEHIVTTLTGLAHGGRVDRRVLEAVVHSWLRRVRQGRFPGFTWLLGLLDEAVQTARLRVSTDLLLFRKALHTLEGVVADVGAGEGRIDAVLLGEFLRHLAAEWPRRWLAPPDSRAFATRLSNADLARVALGLPWAVAQFWLDRGLDLLGPCGEATAPGRTAG
jgi:ubiquinone biosynthesis protein